jgi:hypothetical protein
MAPGLIRTSAAGYPHQDSGPPGSNRKVPRNRYCYLSPINRLQSIYAKTFCKIMDEFRSRRSRWDDEFLHDMHSGSHFKDLLGQPVRWDGEIQQPECNYFAEETDVPLSLMTDGVTLYKQSRLDTWPLILTNYALPPEIRTRMENVICVGLIPGEFDEYEQQSGPLLRSRHRYLRRGSQENRRHRLVSLPTRARFAQVGDGRRSGKEMGRRGADQLSAEGTSCAGWRRYACRCQSESYPSNRRYCRSDCLFVLS